MPEALGQQAYDAASPPEQGHKPLARKALLELTWQVHFYPSASSVTIRGAPPGAPGLIYTHSYL